MKAPLVTVVTPTIGRLEKLREALRSVAAQTVATEHVVIGDNCARRGCAGEVAEVVKEFSNATFYDIRRIENSSRFNYLPARLAYLRNYGARMGRGDYVAHLDDDNRLREDHCESLVAIMRATGAGIAHSWRQLVYADGEPFVVRDEDPWQPKPERRRESFIKLSDQGVLISGSDIVRDRLWDGDDLVARVDTSEYCATAIFFSKFGFPERFSRGEQLLEVTEDMAYARRLGRQGIRVPCTQLPTVLYTMGGYSNRDVVDPGVDRFNVLACPALERGLEK